LADTIRFWHRGELVEVRDVPATTTLLEWLRTERVSMGTKEGCNQGDCGACTVVVGHPGTGPDGESHLDLRPVLACSLLLPMLHGTALFTVEDLASGGELHPVQQAMVDDHGTQCGFCTPGMVMSLWCVAERAAATGAALSAEQVRVGISGNLCRCTGYRSIVEAAAAAATRLDVPRLDPEPALRALAAVGPDDELDYRAAGTEFLAPTSEESLAAALVRRPDAVLLAGGTDLVPSVPGRDDLPSSLVWTGRSPGLSDVTEGATHLSIGGAASLEAAWAALAERCPGLIAAWERFAAPPVRVVGTMAGNLVTGSPVGDSMPVLLVLDAELVLRRGDVERRIPVASLPSGYRTTVLAPGEYISRIDVPLVALALDVRAYKVARRFDSDISTLSGAFALGLEGSRISTVRVAFGGMSAVVHRAGEVERALAGREWDAAALADAQEALARDYAPIGDHRGSADYRRRAAGGLLERWWRQTRPDHPESVATTEVWGTP
jgi:xanthine dehydrogenase small subunit